MPISGLVLPFWILNLHKIGNTQKLFQSHVIKFLRVKIIGNHFATKGKDNKITLYISISMISTVHTLIMHKLIIFISS
jgi:hypothetical protein